MSVQSGRTIGRALELAAERLRRELDEHDASVSGLDEQAKDLVVRRGDALLELARHYLPDISSGSIENAFREVRDELLEVLNRKQRRQELIRAQIASITKEVAAHESRLEEINQALSAKADEREQLEETLAERLHGSEEFQVLSKQALDAELELEKNERRVEEIEKDAAEKLPAYQQSRLFKYLLDRGYGTAKYEKDGIIRRLDGWVSKMIDFPAARRGYHFLKTTPQLIAQEVERRRDMFNGLMERVEAIEDQTADDIGLTEILRQGQQLGGDRDRLVAALAAKEESVRTLDDELLELEGTRNEYYDQALARMRSFLTSSQERRLMQHSRTTSDPRDDAIVAEVAWLNSQLQDVRRRGGMLEKQRAERDALLAGLQEVQQRFRRHEFDSQRSHFHSRFDVNAHVDRYLAGRVGPEGLWNAIAENQRFAPTWHDPGRRRRHDPFDSDVSHVLLRVLGEVAGHALRTAVERGMDRRGPLRNKQRRSSGRPKLPRGGFTRGRGF